MNFIQKNLSLLLLTLIAGLLHFYNLNWGAPFYFHPDERNIASSISQLNFPDQMHPHFFAYGSLPIYAVYFLAVFVNLFSSPMPTHVSFEQAIIVGRFFSALFATLLVPLIYLIVKRIYHEKAGLIAAFLVVTSVGILQFSHYGTFELWLTFFTTLLFWLSLKLLKRSDITTIIYLGLISGLLISTKISHLAVLVLPVTALLLHHIGPRKEKHFAQNILRGLRSFALYVLLVIFVYMVTNPYVFIDTVAFLDSMRYESSVALGTLPVFYTGEFFGTMPVLFHFSHVYPFLLNPVLTIIFTISFVYICYIAIKKKNVFYGLLILTYLILFISQAFLFVKWTRYMVPTLPFIFIICSIATTEFLKWLVKKSTLSTTILRLLLITLHIVFAVSYMITAFVQTDTRLAAAAFAQKVIPQTAPIVSEVYDLGITAFTHPNIKLFNFYDLEANTMESSEVVLKTELTNAEYLILPSQRVLKIRLANKEKFPIGNSVYAKLTQEKIGYHKIYETPCDIFCKITYLGSPIFSYEETASVFDRPTVMIYKKN